MAVFMSICHAQAQTVKDVLTAESFGITATGGYVDVSDVQSASEAIYSGYLAKSKEEAIQLRSTDKKSGIITTASGGKLRSITVVWNSSTLANPGRCLNVYGKHTPYTSVSDLYATSKSKQGTLLATITCGTEESETVSIDGDYEYVGLICGSGTTYVDEIVIGWGSGMVFSPAPGTYSQTQNVIIHADEGETIYYTTTGEDPAPTEENRYGGELISVEETAMIKALSVNDETGERGEVMVGEYVIDRLFAFGISTTLASIGVDYAAPELINTYVGGEIAWASSNESVATVDDAGHVDLLSPGNTIISATLSMSDSRELVASYTLFVKEAASAQTASVYYKKVMSDDDIIDRGIYLIVNEDASMAMGEIASGSGKSFGTGVEVAIQDGIIRNPTGDLEVTLYRQEDGTYAMRKTTGYLGNSSETYFDYPLPASLPSSTLRRYQWTVSVADPDRVVVYHEQYFRYLRYRDVSQDFRVYSDLSRQDVSLYRKVGSLTITAGGRDDTDGRYYATYYTDMPFIVPDGVSCATVGVADGLLLVDDYSAGDVVAAGTGLLVSADAPGTYEYTILREGGNAHGVNLLKGDVVDMLTEGDNCQFYRLAKPTGQPLGFWWGAPDGGPFSLGANKAYLAVPNEVSDAKGFSFSTSVSQIHGLTTEETPAADVIYNLSGQRVESVSRPGVYIANGRKLVVK